MSKFCYASLTVKFQNLTGENWNLIGNNDISKIRKLPKVSLSETRLQEIHIVRDWCQERFGDNWIYEWDDFYFKHEKDAAWFALRWS